MASNDHLVVCGNEYDKGVPGHMQLDPLYVGERLTVVFEAIGDDKVRVNASSWSDAVVIRAEEALEVPGAELPSTVTARTLL